MLETPEPGGQESTDKEKHPVKPGENFFYNSSRGQGRREAKLLRYGENEGTFIAWYQVVGDSRESWQYVDRLKLSAGTSGNKQDSKPIDFIVKVKRSEKSGGQIEDGWSYVGWEKGLSPNQVKVEKEGVHEGQPVTFSRKPSVESLASWNESQE